MVVALYYASTICTVPMVVFSWFLKWYSHQNSKNILSTELQYQKPFHFIPKKHSRNMKTNFFISLAASIKALVYLNNTAQAKSNAPLVTQATVSHLHTYDNSRLLILLKLRVP